MSNAIFLFDNQGDDGIITASSTASGTTPASNVQNSQRSAVWRSGAGTSSSLNCSLSSVFGITHIALVDVNLSTAGTIRLQSWADALGGSSPGVDLTFYPTLYVNTALVSTAWGTGLWGIGSYGLSTALSGDKNITLVPINAISFDPYWRITFTDTNTSYQQLGRLFLGSGLEFTYNLNYGWQSERQDRSVSVESLGGQQFTQPRDDRQQISGVFDFLKDSERTEMLLRMQQVKKTKPFIFSVYPEQTNQGMTTTLYCKFESVKLVGSTYDANDLSFTVIEEL